ncbi:hypothetical protein [Mucilaginibacter sp.]
MKNILFFFAAVLVIISFSSCGIFGKGCGCPEFGKIKQHTTPVVIVSNKGAAIRSI